jgi:ABC-type bacteriocin/lantibiotic exporter with double-glycine peptidase domain
MLPIERFWSLLKHYNSEIRQIYVYAIFNGFVNLTLPLGIQAIINYLQAGVLTSSWVILVCFVLLGIAVTGILQVLQLRIVENIQQDIFARSAFEFAFRIPKINLLQLEKIHAPELVNRFFDILTIQKGLPKILIDFSLAIFQIVFGLILLAIYSSYFIILGMAFVFILWFIFRITGPKGLSTSLEESKYKYKLVHWLEEIARANGSFKQHNATKLHLFKTDDITSGYINNRETHFQVLITQFRFFIGFKVFVAAGLLVLGGFLVFQEQMNIGQFVAAEIIIILIINSVEKVMRIIDSIYDVLTALDKIGYVTDLKLDKNTGNNNVDTSTAFSIEATEIEFGFPNERRKVLDDLSFEIHSNAKTLLKGNTGSGKTVLLQILMGLYQVTDGELYINAVPISHYQRDELFQAIGIAFPSNQIFKGTFKENILMGRDISEKDLLDTIKVLKLDTYFVHQPDGVDCMINSGGKNLPRSIIQKILIARVIINKPKLLLIEDPLQFIEEEEKKRIIDYLMDKKRDWTIVVVSDFYYWEEKCTQIIDLTN